MSNHHSTAHQTGRATGKPASVGDTLRETAQDAAEAVRDAAGRAYESVQDRAEDGYDQARRWASQNYDRYGRRTSQGYRSARGSAEQFISENPVLVGVIGLAAGLLLGSLLPRTRPEDRAFGAWADEVRDQGMRYARDVTQRGREFVEETLSEVADAARGAQDQGGQSPQGGAPAPQGNLAGGREGPSGRHQNV